MRLIDADKLLNKIDAYMCGSQDVMFVKELIKEQPTAFDVDDILRQCKNKAIQLMNKQYNEDEYHMFSKGVQAMYLGLEKIIKENKIYSEIDVDSITNLEDVIKAIDRKLVE